MEHRLLGRTGMSVSRGNSRRWLIHEVESSPPRTMSHLESQLSAAEVQLPDGVLDRIDAVVAPGVTVNPADIGWVSPALDAAARRR